MMTVHNPAMKSTLKPKRKPKRIKLALPDEAAFRDLCGERSANLEQIEKTLDVVLHAPGGSILIDGSEHQRATAKEVLLQLYEQAQKGAIIDRAKVEGELAFVTQAQAKTHSSTARADPRMMIRFGRGHRRIEPRNPAQQAYLQSLQAEENDLVFGIGAAGTGKTFLAVAYGISQLLAGRYKKLVIARPAVEAGEKLGFLPGDLEEKVDPYMMPVWDALDQTIGREKANALREDGKIQIAPLAFMRGRTLCDAYVLLDEAQNASKTQMQMVLTRLGEGGRLVVSGDPDQSDLPAHQTSGLGHALQILQGISGVHIHRFGAKDVIRHPMVKKIVRAYSADQQTANDKNGFNQS